MRTQQLPTLLVDDLPVCPQTKAALRHCLVPSLNSHSLVLQHDFQRSTDMWTVLSATLLSTFCDLDRNRSGGRGVRFARQSEQEHGRRPAAWLPR
jgi:hypothetical protein